MTSISNLLHQHARLGLVELPQIGSHACRLMSVVQYSGTFIVHLYHTRAQLSRRLCSLSFRHHSAAERAYLWNSVHRTFNSSSHWKPAGRVYIVQPRYSSDCRIAGWVVGLIVRTTYPPYPIPVVRTPGRARPSTRSLVAWDNLCRRVKTLGASTSLTRKRAKIGCALVSEIARWHHDCHELSQQPQHGTAPRVSCLQSCCGTSSRLNPPSPSTSFPSPFPPPPASIAAPYSTAQYGPVFVCSNWLPQAKRGEPCGCYRAPTNAPFGHCLGCLGGRGTASLLRSSKGSFSPAASAEEPRLRAA